MVFRCKHDWSDRRLRIARPRYSQRCEDHPKREGASANDSYSRSGLCCICGFTRGLADSRMFGHASASRGSGPPVLHGLGLEFSRRARSLSGGSPRGRSVASTRRCPDRANRTPNEQYAMGRSSRPWGRNVDRNPMAMGAAMKVNAYVFGVLLALVGLVLSTAGPSRAEDLSQPAN